MVQVCWSDLPSGAHSLEVDGEPRLTVEGGGPGSAIVEGLAAGAEVRVSVAGTDARPVRTLSPPPGRELSRVATISDLHIGERRFGRWPRIKPGAEWRDSPKPYPVVCTQAALREALEWGAQLIVVKGDLTDEDRDEDYEELGSILAALPVPGDRDPGQPRRRRPFAWRRRARAREPRRRAHDQRCASQDVPGLHVVAASSPRDRQAPRQPHAFATRDHRRPFDCAGWRAARDAPPAVSHGRHDHLAARDPRPRRMATPPRCRAREPGHPRDGWPYASQPTAEPSVRPDHRGGLTEGLSRRVGRLRRARRRHPPGRAAHRRPAGDRVDRTVHGRAQGMVALLVAGEPRGPLLLAHWALEQVARSVDVVE